MRCVSALWVPTVLMPPYFRIHIFACSGGGPWRGTGRRGNGLGGSQVAATGCVVRTVPAKGLCGIQKGQQSGCREPARSLRTGSGVCTSCAGGVREGEVARL